MCIPTNKSDRVSNVDMLLQDHEAQTQSVLEIVNITLQSFESLSNSMLECTKALASMQERISAKRKKELVYIPLIIVTAALTGTFLGLRKTYQ